MNEALLAALGGLEGLGVRPAKIAHPVRAEAECGSKREVFRELRWRSCDALKPGASKRILALVAVGKSSPGMDQIPNIAEFVDNGGRQHEWIEVWLTH